MIASAVSPPIIALDGRFYEVAWSDGGIPTSKSVILRHIPLSNGRPQPTRHIPALLLHELIAAGEAVSIVGDVPDEDDTKDADHQAIKGLAKLPRNLAGDMASTSVPRLARTRPASPTFDQQRQRHAA